MALCSCTAYKNIEPVGNNNLKSNVDFGGPIVSAFNTKVPIPYLAVGVTYGMTENFDINANLHVLPLAYKFAGLDLGASYFPVINDGIIPTIGLNGTLMLFSSLKSGIEERFKVYPILTSSFAWKLRNGMIYTGAHITIPLSKLDYTENNDYLLSPFIGYNWKYSEKYRLITEIKWQGANVASDKMAVEYIHPSNHGAIGIYLSLERSF